jgi:hypothetical protein
MLREQLENILLKSNETRDADVKQLASSLKMHLEEYVEELGRFLGSPWKDLRVVAVEVIRAIGYPQNANLLPGVLAEFTDPNSPALKEVQHMLDDLEEEVASSYLLQLFFTYAYSSSKNALAYSEILECVGSWLALKGTKRAYAEAVGPQLLATIDRWSEDTYCRDSVLGVLEKIGLSSVDYALPGLLRVAQREKGSLLGKRVWKFVLSFQEDSLALYRLVLDEVRIYYPEES